MSQHWLDPIRLAVRRLKTLSRKYPDVRLPGKPGEAPIDPGELTAEFLERLHYLKARIRARPDAEPIAWLGVRVGYDWRRLMAIMGEMNRMAAVGQKSRADDSQGGRTTGTQRQTAAQARDQRVLIAAREYLRSRAAKTTPVTARSLAKIVKRDLAKQTPPVHLSEETIRKKLSASRLIGHTRAKTG